MTLKYQKMHNVYRKAIKKIIEVVL